MKNYRGRTAACIALFLICLSMHTPAIAQDRRAEARRLVAEAEALQARQTAEDSKNAIKKYEEAYAIWVETAEKKEQANSLLNIGSIYQKMSDATRSIEYFDRALALAREIGDKYIEADTLLAAGISYGALGDARRSLEAYGRALTLAREIHEVQLESMAVTSLGFASDALGDKQGALNYYNQALTLIRAKADKRGEASVLTNMGAVYYSLGEMQRAVEYYQLALPIIGELGDARRESIVLNNMAAAFDALGDRQKALDTYERSIVIKKKIGDRAGEAVAIGNIASIYDAMGDKTKALKLYDEALAMHRELKTRSREALTLSNIGRVYLSQNDYQKAFDYFSKALPIRREVSDLLGESKTLSYLAAAERGRGNLAEALRLIGESILIIESVRASLASPDLRASYFAASQDYYKFQIALLMSMHEREPGKGYDAAALNTSERSRARSLLDILSEARSNLRMGLEPTLLEREKALQKELNVKDQERRREKDPVRAAAIDREINAISASYQDLQSEIRARNPRYAGITQPQPLSLLEAQGLLDADTLLLEYSLGADASYLWIVSQNSIKSFRLAKQADIETAAKALYGSLKKEESSGDAEKNAAELGRLLLEPARAELGTKRLAVVADGVLGYVPFAALTVPGSPEPLVAGHEIVNLPSASTLASLRSETGGRKPAPKTVAVFADPVFDASDTRVDRNAVGAAQTDGVPVNISLGRSTRDAGVDNNLPRLPGTRREAATILAFAPGAQQKRAVDFEASLANVAAPATGQYRIIHFATHGILNSVHPELSGIVLSLVDKKGRPQEGFLRLGDIYDLKLPADLVVLSACQTALGKEIRGEGIVGLTRGFMYAGSPRVVASLWAVDDQATSELMRRFYEGMLGPKKLRPAAALRHAQVEMLRSKRFAAPYYWSAFTIQGEWK